MAKDGEETLKPEVIKELVYEGLKKLTGKKDPSKALKEFVSSKEKVAIKFNAVSRNYIGANKHILAILTELLESIGVDKKRIVPLEAVGCDRRGYLVPDLRRGNPFLIRNTIRGGRITKTETRLTACVEKQVDCIINVPDLKHHGIAGITGALKNIAYAGQTIMTNPRAFHGGMCDPAMAEINNLKPLKEKVRLNIMVGLKGVFHGGPGTRRRSFHFRHDGILLSSDRVAIDRIALEIINEARKKNRKRKLRHVPSIRTAARLELGVESLKRIDWIRKEIKKV